jgi:hypothetical protein
MATTTTLSSYITQTRRLLHDANGNFYSDSELTDYINEARNRLNRDTGVLRSYQTSTVATNQESYSLNSMSGVSADTMDVININLIWGNTRIPLRYLPWTQFNAELRFWQNYVGRPIAYSMYGPSTFYISPVPDQDYAVELDTIVAPSNLVNASDIDTIADNYTSPVAYYAASVAKYKEQSYGESEIFKQEYIKKVQNVLVGNMTRRMPDPYSTPY